MNEEIRSQQLAALTDRKQGVAILRILDCKIIDDSTTTQVRVDVFLGVNLLRKEDLHYDDGVSPSEVWQGDKRDMYAVSEPYFNRQWLRFGRWSPSHHSPKSLVKHPPPKNLVANHRVKTWRGRKDRKVKWDEISWRKEQRYEAERVVNEMKRGEVRKSEEEEKTSKFRTVWHSDETESQITSLFLWNSFLKTAWKTES